MELISSVNRFDPFSLVGNLFVHYIFIYLFVYFGIGVVWFDRLRIELISCDGIRVENEWPRNRYFYGVSMSSTIIGA